MFKVAYVVPIIAPYAIPRYQELAKNKDVEVHIIVEKQTNSERQGWNYENVEGCYTHQLNTKFASRYNIQNRRHSYKINKTRYFPFELKSKIREIKPDVVLVCNSTQIMFLLGKRNYKLGVIVEDTLRAAEGRNKINSILKQIMLKKADFYIPFSNDAIDFLEYNGIKEPLIRSSWSMDKEFFNDLTVESKKVKKIKYGMKDKKNYILTANLIPRKGIMQFISAWGKMNKTFLDNSELYILGDGILKNEIIEYIKNSKLENIHLVGNVSYQEVSHYLQCGDVFVLPTLEDLCSLSVLEAMASGLPVLTTIYNGARQFIKDGENGYIFDPLNEKNVIEILEKINESNLDKFSECSLKYVEEYSTKLVMDKFYKNLACFCEKNS